MIAETTQVKDIFWALWLDHNADHPGYEPAPGDKAKFALAIEATNEGYYLLYGPRHVRGNASPEPDETRPYLYSERMPAGFLAMQECYRHVYLMKAKLKGE